MRDHPRCQAEQVRIASVRTGRSVRWSGAEVYRARVDAVVDASGGVTRRFGRAQIGVHVTLASLSTTNNSNVK